MKLSIQVAALTLLAFPALAAAQENADNDLGHIRATSDGAGPSHLFWLEDKGEGAERESYIGVVDPLFAAVRFYRLAAQPDVAPMKHRLTAAGICALPVDLRPWRIHHRDDAVLIESMPTPAADGYLTSADNFTSRFYRLDRNLLSFSKDEAALAQKAVDTTRWNPSASNACGDYMLVAGSINGRVGRASPFSAVRGKKNPNRTIILTNSEGALSPVGQLVVRATSGNRLYSAQDLEPIGSSRVVLIAEGIHSSDGMVRIRQRILAYSGKSLSSEWSFDETMLRSKLGMRPIAIMPSGEVLVMGSVNNRFQIQSCGLLISESGAHGLSPARGVCGEANDAISARNTADLVPVEQEDPALHQEAAALVDSTRAGSAAAIFGRARLLEETVWSVDSSKLPEECRLANGCKANGMNYVPLRSIRLSRQIFTKKGFPYAMTDDPKRDVSTFLSILRSDEARLTTSLASVVDGGVNLPGNLDDTFSRDLGVDCSALVQLSWGAESSEPRLSTSVLQLNPPSYVCSSRLPGIEYLRSGDAISVNIKREQVGPELSLLGGPNHVVLFAAAANLDGANSSWVVLESSSGCDGVCWSAYDPSFFNGWGLYRARDRADHKCPRPTLSTSILQNPIPRGFNSWRTFLRSVD